MKNYNIGLIALAAAILIAALILADAIKKKIGDRDAGQYEIIRGQANDVIRLNRRTGEVSMCVPGVRGGEACGFTLDPMKP